MAIRRDKNSGIYQIDIRSPSGERIRCSARTSDKQAAREYHDHLKAQLWRKDVLGEEPDHLFEEAALLCLDLWEGQDDYTGKCRHIAYWKTQFAGRTVRSLTFDEICQKLPTHTTHKHRKPKPLSNGSKNRYLATMRRLLKLCKEWKWIPECPVFKEFKEPDVRVRWEPPEVIQRLIEAMTLEWMRDVSLVAVASGMREDELLSLEPCHVNLQQCTGWVVAEEAKNSYARSVPFNRDAMEVLQRRIPKAKKYVFERPSRDGKVRKISQIDARCFKRACEAVGIKDFRFHDLRHTWASWHVQRGTHLMVLKELGGWETLEMVQKYAHLAPSHMATHAETVNFWSNSPEQKKMPPQRAA
jgi:Site-specific recombinase XerD|nr:site-specific integrase [uncultured Pigmentiphaga sp.]